MAHKIVHWELMGADGAGLKSFYADLFGWSLEGVPGFGDYYMTSEDDTGIAGAVGQGNEHMPNYQAMYVEVPDIEAHLAKIEAAGGKTVVPRTVIPDTVIFGLFTDPAGNLVGLVEPD
ncbi:MAG: VOC family protein [Acidimicrobiia bacterium]|nr:VOC family protein [Acidimicrobiia bacterium]MDH5504383.1 VOC family protein [Acidimicrobiia bacterium]